MMTLVKLIDVLVRWVQTLLGQNDARAGVRATLWFLTMIGFAIALGVAAVVLVLAITWLESRGAKWQ